MLCVGNHQLQSLTSTTEDVIDLICRSVHTSVCIYGDQDLQHLLLHMSTLTWREVYLFLSSAIKPELTAAAALFTAVIKDNRQVSFQQFSISTSRDTLPKGVYVLCEQFAQFELYVPDPVIAFSRTSSTMDSPCISDSRSPSPFVQNPQVDLSLVVQKLKRSNRDQSFSTAVRNRDINCLISGAEVATDAAHIVPLNADEKDFPKTILDILSSFSHASFDKGYFALKPLVNPQCYVVLVFNQRTYLNRYHLMPLRPVWVNVTNVPHPTLLTFHLNNSLAKHICGGGLANDSDDNDDEEEALANDHYYSDDDDEEEASIHFEGCSIEQHVV